MRRFTFPGDVERARHLVAKVCNIAASVIEPFILTRVGMFKIFTIQP